MAGLDSVIRAVAIAALLTVGIGGCSQKMAVTPPAGGGDSGSGRGKVEGFTTFPDMPMPVKGEIDVERTLIFGTGDAWFGRMVLNTPHGSGDMFTFYREGLPGFGWKEITSVRAAVSVLTYARDDRVATIQIQGRSLGGSEITIIVSPHGVTVSPATAPQPRAPVRTNR